ncbi:TetR/AcrR family transcriptional regulator [Nocardia sp. NPDC050406]|uniref:TetR/AcrR family transcriptional regulator n=1 Tax=Nocardia sp. NPDC050406 TaxID=3364318 RepID=UPI0037B3FEAB
MSDREIPSAEVGASTTTMDALELTCRRFPEGQRRIFRAAIDAFAERGFHATSTRDIAARAGLSPAALYVHFPSKEAVLHQISVASLGLTRDVAKAASTGPGSPAERLFATVRDLTTWHAVHSASVRVVLHHLTDLTPEHRGDVTDIQREIYRMMRGLLVEGAEAGFDIADPGATTIAVLSLCVDTARWYTPDYRRAPERIGEDHAALALRMVGAHRG